MCFERFVWRLRAPQPQGVHGKAHDEVRLTAAHALTREPSAPPRALSAHARFARENFALKGSALGLREHG